MIDIPGDLYHICRVFRKVLDKDEKSSKFTNDEKFVKVSWYSTILTNFLTGKMFTNSFLKLVRSPCSDFLEVGEVVTSRNGLRATQEVGGLL